MTDRRRLESRVAIVTGGSRGIGRAIVEALAADGADVYFTGRVAASGEAAAMEIRARVRPSVDGSVTFLEGDVSDEMRTVAIVDEVIVRSGRVDILVNNAAVQVEAPLLGQTVADFEYVVRTNLLGPFLFSRAVLQHMVDAGSGVIINMSSVLGLVGDPTLPVYGATKAGLLGLTRSIALAYAASGVRCVAICPADVDTELNQRYFSQAPDPVAFRQRVEHEYPGRRIASVGEIARVAAFLASDDASFISGSHVLVDGAILSRIYEV